MRRPDDHRTVKSSVNWFRRGLVQASHFINKKLTHRGKTVQKGRGDNGGGGRGGREKEGKPDTQRDRQTQRNKHRQIQG